MKKDKNFEVTNCGFNIRIGKYNVKVLTVHNCEHGIYGLYSLQSEQCTIVVIDNETYKPCTNKFITTASQGTKLNGPCLIYCNQFDLIDILNNVRSEVEFGGE